MEAAKSTTPSAVPIQAKRREPCGMRLTAPVGRASARGGPAASSGAPSGLVSSLIRKKEVRLCAADATSLAGWARACRVT
ncbi:hypothetical protein GCM10011322_09830 [Salinarimonas ramus]|uniref:Uncharacterized protein n=1 Tax=Salinarimonas ramus TaxID=690164 RepID=A0A917Q4N5_9HYPH|nr:hypothetical protein GCM10011322_09830 [Salinarimonas ramus]